MSKYTEFQKTPEGGDKLQELARLVHELELAQEAVLRAEKALKEAQRIERDLSEHKIPDLMDEIGWEEATTATGVKVEITEDVRTSIPKARWPQAATWLKVNGHGKAIKREMKLDFRMGEEEKAKKLLDALDGLGYLSRTRQREFVESATLRSIVATALKHGEQIDHKDFGIYRQRRAKIKPSK